MSFTYWRDLAVLTVSNPSLAARELMAMGFARNVLWQALFLVALLNTIIFAVSDMLVARAASLPGFSQSPFVLFGMVAGGLIVTIYSIFWAGRLLGGKAAVADLMVLIIWLQALRLVVQGAALVLVLTVPFLSVLLVFGASLLGLYILLNFINKAHQLGSIARSAAVLVVSMMVFVLGLSLFFGLIGLPVMGSAAHV